MTNERLSKASRQDVSPADESHPTPGDSLAWVHQQTTRGCTLVVLRQRADEGETLVSTWVLPGPGVETIGAEIDRRAHDEGRFLRGPTLFILYAYKDSGTQHVDRKTIRIEGEAFRQSGETEPPNLSGLTSLLMRHTDAATKIALGHTSHIIDQYKSMLAVANRRIVELESALNETAKLRDALMTAEHERKLAEHRAQQEDKRNEFMMGQLKLLVPAVAKRFFGNGPGGAEAGDAVLNQFMDSLKPEQLAHIANALSPAQQAVLGEIYVQHAQRSENAAVAAAARSDAARAAESEAHAPR